MGCNNQAPECVPGNPVGSMGGNPAPLPGSSAGEERGVEVGGGRSCYPESF